MTTTITIISSTHNKCIECVFYAHKENDWPVGDCINKESKARRKHPRFWNDKTCWMVKRKDQE